MTDFARYYFETDSTDSAGLSFRAHAPWVAVAVRASASDGAPFDPGLETHHDGTGRIAWHPRCSYEIVFSTRPIEDWTLHFLNRPAQPGRHDRSISFGASGGFEATSARAPARRMVPACPFESTAVRSLV